MIRCKREYDTTRHSRLHLACDHDVVRRDLFQTPEAPRASSTDPGALRIRSQLGITG